MLGGLTSHSPTYDYESAGQDAKAKAARQNTLICLIIKQDELMWYYNVLTLALYHGIMDIS